MSHNCSHQDDVEVFFSAGGLELHNQSAWRVYLMMSAWHSVLTAAPRYGRHTLHTVGTWTLDARWITWQSVSVWASVCWNNVLLLVSSDTWNLEPRGIEFYRDVRDQRSAILTWAGTVDKAHVANGQNYRSKYVISWSSLSPAEVDSLLGQLSLAVVRVNIWLVPHHLHPLAPSTLLAAVLADHVQLPNPVLEAEERFRMRFRVARIGMPWRKREKRKKKIGWWGKHAAQSASQSEMTISESWVGLNHVWTQVVHQGGRSLALLQGSHTFWKISDQFSDHDKHTDHEKNRKMS